MSNPDSLNPSQRGATEFGIPAEGRVEPTPPLLVIAGAGSGKTKTLAHRVARLVAAGAEQHSDIRIRLTTEFFEWDDFLAGVFDVGFRLEGYGHRPSEIEVLPMFSMVVVPACAPALLNGPTALRRPEDLAKFTLLHEGSDRHD